MRKLKKFTYKVKNREQTSVFCEDREIGTILYRYDAYFIYTYYFDHRMRYPTLEDAMFVLEGHYQSIVKLVQEITDVSN